MMRPRDFFSTMLNEKAVRPMDFAFNCIDKKVVNFVSHVHGVCIWKFAENDTIEDIQDMSWTSSVFPFLNEDTGYQYLDAEDMKEHLVFNALYVLIGYFHVNMSCILYNTSLIPTHIMLNTNLQTIFSLD
jgi:hypothetical protein